MTLCKRYISVLLCLSILFSCAVLGAARAAASSYEKRTIKVGGTYTLWPNTEVSQWTTSNAKVASVDEKGVVRGISAGVAQLRFFVPAQPYAPGGEYVYTFTVEDVRLNKTRLNLYVGSSAALSLDNPSGKVSWSSKNKKIASVSSKGVVKGISPGTTQITAVYNKKSYTCSVTVKIKPIKLNKTKASLTAGSKLTLTLSNTSGKVSWSSSNKKVASVSSKGVVTAKKKGKATIKARYKNKTYKCKLTVKAKKIPVRTFKNSAVFEKGETLKLTVRKVKASGIKWKSSNKKVVAVRKGVITAKKAGKATITAKYGKKKKKCSVRVFSTKALGTKTLSDTNNTASISNVKVFCDPSMFSKSARLTVKKASGLPKNNGVSMKTYDFSLNGAKVSKSNAALVEIPQKVGKNEIPVAAYFNEKTGSWEREICSYSNGKISILLNHFSLHGVGTVKKSYNYNIYDANTTEARVYSFWAPSATLSGEEAVKIMGSALKSPSATKGCIDLGWNAVNELFDKTVNWTGNIFTSFGFKGGNARYISDFLGENTSKLGAIGFGLAFISAVKYAWEGQHAQAASTVMQGYIGLTGAVAAQWLGTTAISAASFATAFVGYCLNTIYDAQLTANEKKWYKVYYKYYEKGYDGYRLTNQWRDILLPILKSKKSSVYINNAVEAEVDKYVNAAWNSEWFTEHFYAATGLASTVSGGVNKTIKSKLSAEHKEKLMNGTIKLVYEWYARRLQKDAEETMKKNAGVLADDLNTGFTISFYDGSRKKGKTSQLKGWTVRWKNIPGKLKDKQKLKIKLDKAGKGSTAYTLYAAIEYGIKPRLEIVSPKGKVVEARSYTISSTTTKINLMSSKVKKYISDRTYALNKTKASINVGNKLTLKLSNAKAADIKWRTSNKKIAVVTRKGVVKGVKAGTAKITAVYKKKKFTCVVTVKPNHRSWKLTSSKTYMLRSNQAPIVKTGNSDTSSSYGYVIKCDYSADKNYILAEQTIVSKNQKAAVKATVTLPQSVLLPNKKLTIKNTVTTTSRSEEYDYLASFSSQIYYTGVNPQYLPAPEYSWLGGGFGGTSTFPMDFDPSNETEKSSQISFTVPKTRIDKTELQTGDVFYITLRLHGLYGYGCYAYRVFTYTYK